MRFGGRQGSGRELGYAEITSNFVQVATGGVTANDITGLTLPSVVVGARPIDLSVFLPNVTSGTAATDIQVRIYEGATMLTLAAYYLPTINKGVPGIARVRLAPTVGVHSYKAAIWGTATTTLTILAGATAPAHFTAREV